MAEAANTAAEASPSAIGRSDQPAPAAGQDSQSTPAVASAIPASNGQPKVSPSSANPRMATQTGSALTSAVVTTNERSFIAASINAVATTWASAPAAVHATETA